MATESVDDLDELLVVLGSGISEPFDPKTIYGDRYGEWIEKNKNGPRIVKAKAALEAYYTRECARKVLEAREDELKTILSEYQHRGIASDYFDNRSAELRAAIEEVGGAMPEPQQPKPLEEKKS